MKRIYDLITKANQVLFFLVAIGAIVAVSLAIYQSTRPFKHPQMPVVQNPSESAKTTVEDVRFLGVSDGIFVFGVVKRAVGPGPESAGGTELRMATSWGSRDLERGQIVNVTFSKSDQRVKVLLPNDGLVIDHELVAEHPTHKFGAHLFKCVAEDTNGDHVLSADDRTDLYIVARDLSRPDIVVRGVVDFDVVSANHVLVKMHDGQAPRFVDIDIETAKQTDVAWK